VRVSSQNNQFFRLLWNIIGYILCNPNLRGGKSMLWWLETQETLVIVLIVFAFCYLLAALILVGLAVLSRSPIAGALQVTTPAMLTPLAVIFGLVIAFLATRVWGNLDHAQAYVVEEASGIREAVLISRVLPSDTRDALRKEIENYLNFVDQVDWPAMLRGQEGLLHQTPAGLPEALTILLSFVPQQPGQQLAQSHAVTAIEQVLQARRKRILLSEAVISLPQWMVIIVLDALVLFTIGTVHASRYTTAVVNMAIFSTAVASCVVLLMINDRPFNSGGIAIQPTALHELGSQ
jgi:hypothetical protein